MIATKNLKDDRVQVTFALPEQPEIESASLVGDFNDWNPEATPMKRSKKGGWRANVKLAKGHTHEFRYLLNGEAWRNDDQCDRCPNPFGGENSVLSV